LAGPEETPRDYYRGLADLADSALQALAPVQTGRARRRTPTPRQREALRRLGREVEAGQVSAFLGEEASSGPRPDPLGSYLSQIQRDLGRLTRGGAGQGGIDDEPLLLPGEAPPLADE
jgi:hypothetical protein